MNLEFVDTSNSEFSHSLCSDDHHSSLQVVRFLISGSIACEIEIDNSLVSLI